MMALIGNKNKKYGLILPTKKKADSGGGVPSSVFAEESDEDDKEFDAKFKGFDSRKETMRAQMKKQTQVSIESVLTEDPSVYEYDSVYDSIHANRERKTEQKRGAVDRKPKYMEKLLKFAHERKLDRELQNDRKVQMELEAEGDEFKDKEKFVTASYKKKMEELRTMEARRRQEALVEEAFDVTKQDGLGGFYRYMMHTQGSEAMKTEKEEEEQEKKESSSKPKGIKEESPSEPEGTKEESSSKPKGIKEESSSEPEGIKEESPTRRRHRSRSPRREEKTEKRKEKKELERLQKEEKRKEQERQEEAVKAMFARRTDTSSAQEARERYLARRQRARAPVVESDSD